MFSITSLLNLTKTIYRSLTKCEVNVQRYNLFDPLIKQIFSLNFTEVIRKKKLSNKYPKEKTLKAHIDNVEIAHKKCYEHDKNM